MTTPPCRHNTAIVLHKWRSRRLTYLRCTWACCQPYWMHTVGIISRVITAEEAMTILEERKILAAGHDAVEAAVSVKGEK